MTARFVRISTLARRCSKRLRSPAESESLPPTPIAFFAAAFLALLRMLIISGCSAAILRKSHIGQKSSEWNNIMYIIM